MNFKKLDKEAILPSFGNEFAAGIDFYALDKYPGHVYTIPAQSSAIIPTGIAWEPESGSRCALIIQSRSGMALKWGIECSNAGVIDSDYRGEIKIKLYNTNDDEYVVHGGDRIAQGIVYTLPDVILRETKELSETERGANGFGSTGR